MCEHSCARLKPFETSAPMHCDDYELNSRLNYAITTCAISFERIVPALELLGLRAVSTTDHYGFKVNALASRIAARVFTFFSAAANWSSKLWRLSATSCNASFSYA